MQVESVSFFCFELSGFLGPYAKALTWPARGFFGWASE
jgi:hypothetical protein